MPSHAPVSHAVVHRRPRMAVLLCSLLAILVTAGMSLCTPQLAFAAASGGSRSAVRADDGFAPLAATPPMGWNDWNRFGCDINEEVVRQTADALVSSGLAAKGYRYVNVDDCWEASSRDAGGGLTNDPQKFPSGMKALADYVHSKGLKFGLYTAVGDKTCQQRPGSGGHYAQDAADFASWGVDYVKLDWCGATGDPQALAGQFRAALDATGRPMVLSVSRHGEGWTWKTHPAQLWRTSADISDDFASMLRNAEEEVGLADSAGPGHWNDPDMLEVGNGGMSADEYRAHLSLWSVLAAPLISGTDLRDASPETLSLLGNTEVIAVDQDPAGRQADRLSSDGDREVWVRRLADGSRAVVLFNRSVTSQRISTDAGALGLSPAPAYAVRDLWTHTTRTSTGPVSAFVPAHGAAMFKVSEGRSDAPARTTLSADTGLLAAGKPTTVTVRAETAGRDPLTDPTLALGAPDGWTVTPRTAHAGNATPERPATARFVVTPPADAAEGPRHLTLSARFTSPGGDGPTEQSVEDTVVVPPAAPAGDTALSDHPRLESDNGWYMPLRVNQSFGDDFSQAPGTLTLAGRTFGTGLGTYASSQVSYYLGGACSRFDLTAGVDDEVTGMTWPKPQNPTGTVAFTVYGDGKPLMRTGTMTAGQEPAHRVLDVGGVNELKLVNTSAQDGNFLDHGDWAGMRATCR